MATPSKTEPKFIQTIRDNADIALAAGVFGMLAVMMVPIPPVLLDVMLATSITVSLLVFLVAIYTKRPVEFSVFPTVLLVTTLFRLSLNVASTRLILLHGDEGVGAAGHVIYAAGMLVTRVNDLESGGLDAQIGRQMLGNPRVLGLLAALTATVVMVPGLRIAFLIVTVLVAGAAWATRGGLPVADVPLEALPKGPTEPRIEDLLRVEPLAVELGVDLLYLADEAKGGALVERVQRIRRQLAQDLGVILPTVRLRDNLRLTTGQYRVLLRGEVIGQGSVVARLNLALDPGSARGPLKGTPGTDPVFGLKGFWIADSQRLRAQAQGYTVVDVTTVLTTHLEDLLKRHAHELFGRQQLADLLERVAVENPKLVEELIPDPLSRATVVRVFRNLVAEGIGMKNTQGVLEALAEYAPRTRDPDVLTEFVRQRLSRTITARFLSEDRVLRYVGLGSDAEDAVSKGLQGTDGGVMSLLLDPETTRKLIVGVRAQIEGYSGVGEPVLLVPPLARGPLRRLLEKAIPRIAVLSPGEILPGTAIERVGEVVLGGSVPAKRMSA